MAERDLRAWEKMVLARDHFLRFNLADNRSARHLLEEALAFDPGHVGAIVHLGQAHWIDARFDFSLDRDETLRLAEAQAEAPSGSPRARQRVHAAGGTFFLRDRHDDALALCRQAVDLAPGDSWVQAFLGLVCVYAGEAAIAIAASTQAMALSPHFPAWYTYNITRAHLWAGDLASAEAAADAYLEREPDEPFSYTNFATVYGFRGSCPLAWCS